MKEKRRRVIPTVFCVILDGSKVLLLRRADTGWMDGYYDLPAGHLHDQETLKDGAIRELKEEAGLIAKPEDLKLVHIYQNHNAPKDPHYGHIFLVKKWSGQPRNGEPDKCDDMGFFELDNLPQKVTPYVREALGQIYQSEVSFGYYHPDSMSQY